jgi:rSAM/selenodomain-associated transferase 1
MRAQIAVFTKAPVPGQTKTRLMPLLGAEGAAAAQRAMTWKTLETACAVPDAEVSLWCAGEIDHPFLLRCAAHFDVRLLAQCEGELGARMAHCLASVLEAHERALLIGSDCPAFNTDHLARAIASLDAARMVFTPAEDGGYVLVGARRGGLAMVCFDDMRWSVPQVMEDSRARLRKLGWRPGVDWREMETLWDVDTPEDYVRAEGLIRA